jgi:hypothetical protein
MLGIESADERRNCADDDFTAPASASRSQSTAAIAIGCG